MAIVVWTLVISAKCLAQVQSFSAWKAWLNIVLSVTAIVIPILIFLLIFLIGCDPHIDFVYLGRAEANMIGDVCRGDITAV